MLLFIMLVFIMLLVSTLVYIMTPCWLAGHVGVPVGGRPGCLAVAVTGQLLDIGCVWRPGLVELLLPGWEGREQVPHAAGVADVLQHVQVVAIRCICPWLEGDLLQEVVVLAGLPLVGPHGDPGAHWCGHGHVGHLCRYWLGWEHLVLWV